MSTTTTAIAIATAGGLAAVGIAGAATTAQAGPAAQTAVSKSEGAKAKGNRAATAKAKQVRAAAMRRQLMTLPDSKRLPLKSYYVGAGWGHSSGPHAGRNHKGFDFAARSGSPIHSVSDGKVVMARPYYGYGNLVIVRTPTGKRVLYAHQSKILVKRGQPVRAGQVIGRVGSTGHSTGPHLHLETRSANDRAFDPQKFLGVSKYTLNNRAHKLARLG